MLADFEIAVLGGGIVGAATALSLGQHGFRIALFDRISPQVRSSRDFDGRAYAISVSSCRFLQAVGLTAVIDEHGEPITAVKISEGLAGRGASPGVLEFTPEEIYCNSFGCMLEDRHIRAGILEMLEEMDSIDHLSPAEVSAVDADQGYVEIRLATGKTFRSQCVIICDGRSTRIADRLGFKFSSKDFGQNAVTCAVSHELAHQGHAHQFFMPNGPIAILPLPNDRSAVVWTETKHRADFLAALSDEEFLKELLPCFGGFLGSIRLAGKRSTWPIRASLAQNLVSDRIALAGDAARRIHPLAGQGLNLGLRDVAALTEMLVLARRRGEDFGQLTVLERYHQWRSFDSVGFSTATDFFNQIFSTDGNWARAIRKFGMLSVGQVPPLRRALLREAAGMSGDLPKLMVGQVI